MIAGTASVQEESDSIVLEMAKVGKTSINQNTIM